MWEDLKTLFWLAVALVVMLVAWTLGVAAFCIATAIFLLIAAGILFVNLIVTPWLDSKSWPA